MSDKQHRTDHRVVTVVVWDDCPNRELAVERITQAASNVGVQVLVDVREVRATNVPDVAAEGLHGSPTILVDGSEPFPVADGTTVSCRLYRTDVGLEGAPSVGQLEEVLRR